MLNIAFSCPHIPSCALQTAKEHMIAIVASYGADCDEPSRMLKKSASVVLSSQESSTYPEGTPPVLASPAALLNGHFEHPAGSDKTIRR
jgi:hypothetical protein